MINVDITISGMNQAEGMLNNLKAAVEDMSMEMSDLGDYFMNFFSGDVYDSEGAVFNHPWQALSPAYEIQKAKKWGGGQILVASGEMKQSYSLQTSPNQMTISNSKFYAGYHQSGTSKMPRRVLMDFDQPRIDHITNTILNGIIGKLGI